MIIVPPPDLFNILLTHQYSSNSKYSGHVFDGKLFFKVFGSITISSFFLFSNFYASYETYQKINNKNTLKERIEKAEELKDDFKKEGIVFKPLLLGEFFTAKYYLIKKKSVIF